MKKHGFTLIELMVVMGLIAILFVLAIPSFENANRRDVNRPAQQFASALRLARQAAIVRHQWTFVVVPTRDGSFSRKNLDRCLHAYAVLAATNMAGVRKSTPYDKIKKEFVSDWKKLPDGVYFDENKNTKNNNAFKNPVKGSIDPANPNGTANRLAVVAFKPDGQALCWNGNTWANDYISFYILSSRFYDVSTSGNTLDDPTPLSTGATNQIQISRQRGSASIKNPNED
jgi:prepilin-type N-terminal cleavage/methylation domain-containing protein